MCTSVLPFEQNPPAANLHFDEAWFAHAKFSPIYDGFFALSGQKASVPVFVSQSTHKMLSALSQGSMLHTRDGLCTKIPYGAIEETYAMHSRFAQNYRWKKVVRRVEGRLVFWSMATRICKNRQ